MVILRRFLQSYPVLPLVVLLTYGCGSSIHMPPVSTNPTQSYRLQKETNGLAVAADPYVEEDRLIQYFGRNLVQNKVLPVQFVIENRQGKDGFMVEGGQIMMKLGDQATRPGTDQASVTVPATGQALHGFIAPLALAGIFVPLAGTVAIALVPFLLVAGIKEDEARKINDNLTKKALIDRTLYPAETASGFVYFPLSQPGQVSDITGFVVKVKNLKTNQVVEVVLPSRQAVLPGRPE